MSEGRAGEPTLLLLCGNMCDARMWQGVMPKLSGWTVAFPDLRAASIDAMAADILRSHPGPLIPVGFSMGGILALALSRLAPERIAAIALIDSNPSADLPERAAARPAQQAAVRDGAMERIVVDHLLPSYFAAANASDDVLRSLVLDMAMDLGAEIFLRQSEALRTRPDQWPTVEALAVPALIACGEEDRLCPPEWHRRMAATIPGAELHIVPGAGHMLPIEQPESLAARLNTWLSRVREMTHAQLS